MDMTTKHDLPSGGWVELRNAHWLRAKDRNALMRRIVPEDADSKSKIDLGFEALNEIGALMIVAWSLPYEPDPEPGPDGTDQARSWTLPKNDPSILDELLAPDAVALEDLLAEARKVLMPQGPSPDQSDDPESPSGPGNA